MRFCSIESRSRTVNVPSWTLCASRGEKLERYGRFYLARPEPKALWDKTMSEAEWSRLIHTRFTPGAGFGKAGKEDIRTVLHFSPKVAPIKVAIFPLIKKDEAQDKLAREIFTKLQKKVNCMWDVSGAIGRRYRRQDEAGTPWCITVDAQSVQDGTFTVRERDSMEQKRMTYPEFLAMMYEALEF